MPTTSELQSIASAVRATALRCIHAAGGGHSGGSLSCADILVVLYFHTMHHTIDGQRALRDRFILSKGHSVESYHAVLAQAGFFDPAVLDSYGQFDSALFGHPTMKLPGVEAPTGALGHGLSIGIGMALAAKRDARNYRVYVLMGDGEQAEGSVWEAAMAASHYRLDNLVAIIDHNKLQISGAVDDVMAVSPLAARWAAFGWDVHCLDGNNIAQLVETLDALPRVAQQPTLIVAHTTKGKGVSFMENNIDWHHRVPTDAELAIALDELARAAPPTEPRVQAKKSRGLR